MTEENNTPAAGTEEPSIEEILASIRKIISDEPEKAGQDEAAAEETPAALEAVQVTESPAIEEETEEILDLAPFAAPAEVAPSIAQEPPIELSFDDVISAPVIHEPFSPPSSAPMNFAPLPPLPDDGLLSSAAAAAVTGAMQKLTQPAGNPLMNNTIMMGVKTLEQVVEELLRPLLAQWCDEHLPKMVERAVERELARLARRLEDYR